MTRATPAGYVGLGFRSWGLEFRVWGLGLRDINETWKMKWNWVHTEVYLDYPESEPVSS